MKTVEEYRQFNGEIRVLERRNEWLYDIEVWALSDPVNLNNWKYPVNDNVAKLFLGKPLLTAYLAGGTVYGGGHNFREFTDPETGEPRGDFTGADAERIVGSLSENPEDIRVEERDGNKWIIGRGTLWEWYCLQLCEQIRQLAEQGRTMPVSIETLVTASHMDGDIEVMDEFIVLGVTILGINVTPAVAGARITALRALEGEFAELKIRAASYNGEVNPAEPGTEPNPEQESVGDPPTATNEKGGNRALILNKKQLAKLNERFQGYVVLAASQNDDSGEMTVKLRNDAFEAFTYKMANNEETVAPERIVPTMMSVNLGDEFTVDATDLFDALYGANTKLNSEKDTVSKELEAARETIKQMTERENKRRVKAAQEAAKNALASFNANRENPVDESAIAEILKNAEDGKYTECEDENGEFCGDKMAERDCYAVCGMADAKERKEQAEINRNTYIWDKTGKKPVDDGGIAGLLSRKGIR